MPNPLIYISVKQYRSRAAFDSGHHPAERVDELLFGRLVDGGRLAVDVVEKAEGELGEQAGHSRSQAEERLRQARACHGGLRAACTNGWPATPALLLQMRLGVRQAHASAQCQAFKAMGLPTQYLGASMLTMVQVPIAEHVAYATPPVQLICWPMRMTMNQAVDPCGTHPIRGCSFVHICPRCWGFGSGLMSLTGSTQTWRLSESRLQRRSQEGCLPAADAPANESAGSRYQPNTTVTVDESTRADPMRTEP